MPLPESWPLICGDSRWANRLPPVASGPRGARSAGRDATAQFRCRWLPPCSLSRRLRLAPPTLPGGAAQNAVRADQQAIAVTDTLYDSLLQEIRLTCEVRQQGYGEKVRQLVDQAQHLPTTRVDDNELRRQLSLTMGDFVAYPPVVIRPSGGEASSIRLSSNGREIIVGLSNGRLQVYDVETGQLTAELEAFVSTVLSIALTADDNRLTVVDQAGEVRMWRRLADQWRQSLPFTLQINRVRTRFSCRRKVNLSPMLTAPCWKCGKWPLRRSLREFPTEPDWMMRNAAFDLANRRLFGGFMNGKADTVGWALWDLDTAERLHLVTMPSLGNTYSNGIDLGQNGDRLAIGFDEALLVYEMADFQRTSFFGFDATKAVSFSPTSPYLAAVNIRGWVSVWNSVTNRQLATLEHPRPGASRDDLAFTRRWDASCRVKFRLNSRMGSCQSEREDRHDGS